jgi:hypothetical protein
MSALTRWRLATPLIILSLLCLGATALGAWAYWSVDSTSERALTAFLGIMFATALAASISIGTDRKVQDVPWLRIGTVILLFVLACGVALVRRSL